MDGQFGFGISSTSFIESLWHALKSKILGIYKHIPSKYFVSYLREAEFKVKNANKNYDEKMKEFTDCYLHNVNIMDVFIESGDYLSDSDSTNEESDSD